MTYAIGDRVIARKLPADRRHRPTTENFLPPRIALIVGTHGTDYLIALRVSNFGGVRWHSKHRACPAANVVRLATPREVEMGQVGSLDVGERAA